MPSPGGGGGEQPPAPLPSPGSGGGSKVKAIGKARSFPLHNADLAHAEAAAAADEEIHRDEETTIRVTQSPGCGRQQGGRGVQRPLEPRQVREAARRPDVPPARSSTPAPLPSSPAPPRKQLPVPH